MQGCQPSQILFDYLQQELPQDQLFHIRAHLQQCAACRGELNRLRQQMQQVRATLAQLDPAQGRPTRPHPDFARLPAHPMSSIPAPRLAVALTALVVMILSGVALFSEKHSVLANSISQLKVIMDVSAILNRATSMDCSVLKSEAGNEYSIYRLRWSAKGITRVDRESTDGVQQTLWISDTTVPPDPVWQPAMEFPTPMVLARQIEGAYGPMQAGQHNASGPDEFLLIGREDQQIIEIAIDERTYLPKTLKKCFLDKETGAEGKCVLEARFLWNRPVAQELLIPRPAGRRR
jgi:hypothetical protein